MDCLKSDLMEKNNKFVWRNPQQSTSHQKKKSFDEDLEFIPEDPTQELLLTSSGELQAFSSCQYSLKLLNFICPKCRINCGSYNMYQKHLQVEHNFPQPNGIVESLQCKLCPFKYCKGQSIQKIFDHFPRHMPKSRYVLCTICKLCFDSPADGEYHVQKYHGILGMETHFSGMCESCKKFLIFKVKKDSRKLCGGHLGECQICGQRFHTY